MVTKRELCIVHIGMPKTGSSTLQESFFCGIDDERVSYANSPVPNQSSTIYGLFMEKPEGYHYFVDQGFNTTDVKHFRQRNKKLLIDGFLSHKGSIEIISGEDLFHLTKNGIERLKTFLEIYFHRIIIVAYVRPAKSFMESAFQQKVKYHNLGSFNFNLIYHKYKNFERYDDVMGRENVKLWKFDPKNFPGGDIMLDFYSRLGLKPTKSKIKVVNESLSMEAISILFTYHFHKNSKSYFGINVLHINHLLVEKIKKIGNTKFRFSNKLAAKVIEQHKDDYDWINVRINGVLQEDLNLNVTSGISTENELMWYATEQIEDLAEIVGRKNITFELKKHPQTVAKLVDLLMLQLSRGIK